jgi:hypothetical protein
MRQLRLTTSDLVALLAHPAQTGQDHKGNPFSGGRIRGVWIRVVIARDDPRVVITVLERRKGHEGRL